MQITAGQICELLNGNLEGDPDTIIVKPSKIEQAEAGDICFLANPKYEKYVYTTKASVLLVSEEFQPNQSLDCTLIRVKDVYSSVAILLDQYDQKNGIQDGVDEQAFMADDVKMGVGVAVGKFAIVEKGAALADHVKIYPQVFIGSGVKIGASTVVHPGAKIYHDCIIGENCVIHSNAVIGCDGFGFAPQGDGSFKKVAQVGNVVIEDGVEVGANTTIDRATMGSTLIKKGAKIDNLVMLAHNVVVGENTVIAAQAGVAGSTKIGKNVMIGGQAGFAGHLNIGDESKIQAQAGLNASLDEGSVVYGSPALPYNDFLRAYAIFRRLPDLSKQIKQLEKALESLDNS